MPEPPVHCTPPECQPAGDAPSVIVYVPNATSVLTTCALCPQVRLNGASVPDGVVPVKPNDGPVSPVQCLPTVIVAGGTLTFTVKPSQLHFEEFAGNDPPRKASSPANEVAGQASSPPGSFNSW